MSVHLHIDRLVLDGLDLDRFEARRLQVAFERMLAVRLAEPGVQAQLQRMPPASARQSTRERPVALRPVERGAGQIAERVVAQLSRRGARGHAPR
jgi:hypothetical protein